MAETICDICYSGKRTPPFAEACAIVPVRVFPTRPGQALHVCENCEEILELVWRPQPFGGDTHGRIPK